MSFLYKYMSVIDYDETKCFFNNLKITYNHIENYNDPLELTSRVHLPSGVPSEGFSARVNLNHTKSVRSQFSTQHKDGETYPLDVSKIRDFVRFTCFTEVHPSSDSKRNGLMWAHYANNHKGIAIALKADSQRARESFPVYYSDKPVVFEHKISDLTDGLPVQDFYWKYLCWEYEGERRHFKTIDQLAPEDKDKKGLHLDALSPSEISHIFLGVHVSEKLIQYAKAFELTYGIPVFQMRIEDGEPEFRFIPSKKSLNGKYRSAEMIFK